jgi:phage terminase large subunit GpA-like protein
VRANQTLHHETGRDLVFAGKGEDGWGHPAIGQPKLVDIDVAGHKIRQGCKLWKIGTWPLKAQVYTMLGKERKSSDFSSIPAGFCHFPAWADQEYFKQLTAERLVDMVVRGVATGKKWDKMRENHFLDCRVGNMALFEHLTAGTTEGDWKALALLRGVPEEAREQNLFTAQAAEPEPETQTYRQPPDEGERWNSRFR